MGAGHQVRRHTFGPNRRHLAFHHVLLKALLNGGGQLRKTWLLLLRAHGQGLQASAFNRTANRRQSDGGPVHLPAQI